MDSVWVTIFFFQSILMIIIGFLGYKNHSIKKTKTSSDDSNIKNYFIFLKINIAKTNSKITKYKLVNRLFITVNVLIILTPISEILG